MILHKHLTIGGKPVEFDSEVVSLNLFTPGTASFKVLGNDSLSGVVVFSISSEKSALNNFFIGYIEGEPARPSKDYSIVFCRELTALLRASIPLALRSCTLIDVLSAINKHINLSFNSSPDQTYTTKKAPYFYSLGNGYHCMDSLASVYDIPKLVWQQQANAAVYVGSWDDSFYSSRPVPVPANLFSKHKVGNKAVLPPSSKLRPGVMIEGLGIVESVLLQGDEMTITWSKNPWNEK